MRHLDVYVSYILLALALSFFLIGYFKRIQSASYKRILLFLIIMACVEMINYYYYRKGSNLFLSHAYFFLRFLALSFFYRSLLKKAQLKLVDFFLIFCPLVFILYHLGGIFSFYNIIPFHPFEVFVLSAPIILFAGLHTYNSIENRLNFIYVNFGLLIYMTVGTLVFIAAYVLNSGESSKLVVRYLWNLNSIFWIVCLLLFIFEWWKNYRIKTTT